MKIYKFSFLVCICLLWGTLTQAQLLSEIESELKVMAQDILLHDSLNYKIEQNKKFTRLLIRTLKRKESFNYNFDSLKTISILKPADNSFRIFTWFIVDKNYKEYYGEQYHYYFGLVQRKYTNEDGRVEYVVIPLIEMPQLQQGVENMVLDNNSWVGALYYLPRNEKYIPSYNMKYYNQHEQKQKKQKFYLLMGWNGHDLSSNYKVIDAISMDMEDKNKVIFGANVFYFDVIPKHRAIFHYSEYAPFSLNFSYVKGGPFNLFNKKMIVYDHLAMPGENRKKLQELYELGPDGSYDGLSFIKSKGQFKWYKNVVLAEKFNNKQTRRQQELVREREQKRLKEAGIELSNQ